MVIWCLLMFFKTYLFQTFLVFGQNQNYIYSKVIINWPADVSVIIPKIIDLTIKLKLFFKDFDDEKQESG